MKLKRFMLVTFVLLAILTIGAVSATDATDDSKLSQVLDNFEIVNSPVADEVLADDYNEPEEGSEGSPIDIYDEAYVGDNIVDVRLENGSSGYVKINDDEDNEFFNKDLADDGWDSETDEEDDNYVHYRISSSMLAPELSAGEHTLNVFVFNENDEEIASNSKTVNLFDRDVYDENGVHIEIEVLQISLEENNAIVSIKALADATNNVNVVLNGDEDNYEFEKALNEFSTIEDDEDENYKWYFIKPSDFEGIKSGDYFLQLAYTIDENTINRETNIRLVSDDENNGDGDDEGFEFDYWVRHIVSIDDSDRDIVSFNDPGEGTLNITISGNGETHIITCELNSDERVELILEDLEIIEMGVYQISAKYITLSGDESDFEEGQLIVGYAAIVDEFDIRDGDATGSIHQGMHFPAKPFDEVTVSIKFSTPVRELRIIFRNSGFWNRMLISCEFGCINGNIGTIYKSQFSGTAKHSAECFFQYVSSSQKIDKTI